MGAVRRETDEAKASHWRSWDDRLVRAWCARGLKPTRSDSKGPITKRLLRAWMRGWEPVMPIAGIDLSRR
jgi:hypothetical protein